MGESVRRWAVAAVVAWAGCAGSRARPEVDKGLCFAERPAGMRKEAWNDWNAPALMSLLVAGIDRATGRLPVSPTDCTGTPILWQEPDAQACREIIDDARALPMEPLRETDVVMTPNEGDRRLVWVIVRRFTNGEGEGPVAIVESNERGHSVRAIGTLRAMTQGARLSLQPVGAQDFLAAEGQACSDIAGDNACQRRIRLVALRGGRFHPELLTDASGACIGPAVLHVDRRAVKPLSSGWMRRFELTSAVQFVDGSIRVSEQIAVKDWDRREPGTPPRVFRRAQTERTVRVVDGKLVVDVPSLWRSLVEEGAVEQKPRPTRGGDRTGRPSGSGTGGAPKGVR